MSSTYRMNQRNAELARAFEGRNLTQVSKIKGTGPGYSRTFWLSIEDRSLRHVGRSIRPDNHLNIYITFRSTLPSTAKAKGSAFVAINHWPQFFSTRKSYVEVLAGTAVTIRMEPVRQTTTENFRQLDVKARKCLLPSEQHVSNRRRC